MQKYIRKNDHCPYCGGSLSENSAGELVCEYCLERVELTSSTLGYGFDLLSAGDFSGAQKFFYSSSEVEASYGLFLAMHKINENQVSATEIDPIIYDLSTTSFTTDRYYINAKKRNAKNKIILRRLEQIEQTRVSNLANAVFVDVVTIGDCGEAAKILRNRGYVVSDNCENAVLRSASVMIAYVTCDEQMDGLVDSGIVEKFSALHQGVLSAKRAIIFTSADYKSIVGEITRIAQFAPVSNMREIGEKLMESSLPSPRKKIDFTVGASDKKAFLVEPKRFIPYVPLGEIKNDDAAMARLVYSVESKNFSDAARIATKLINSGIESSEVYFLKALALDELTRETYQKATSLSDAALKCIESAIAHSQNTETAKEYLDGLVTCARNAIGGANADAAVRILDTINIYGLDVSSGALTNLGNALKTFAAGNLTVAADVFDRLPQIGNGKLVYELREQFIKQCLEQENYAIAEKFARKNAESEFASCGNLELLLFVENKAKNFAALMKNPTIRLGNTFRQILAAESSVENAIKKLELYFDVILAHIKADKKMVARESVLDELISYNLSSRGISADKICELGEYGLSIRAYDSAKKYFVAALTRDEGCYNAYWGLLKAELQCDSDTALIDCETDISSINNYFSNAFSSAYAARDEAFTTKIMDIKAKQANAEYSDGCVFRRSDYVIESGKVVAYKGVSARIWLPSSYIIVIGDGAFWGNEHLREVKIGEGVEIIGSEAFGHCVNLEKVTVPSSVRECDNAFVFCNKLDKGAQNIFDTSGGKKKFWSYSGGGWSSLLGGMSNNFSTEIGTKKTSFSLVKLFDAGEKLEGGFLSQGESLIYFTNKKINVVNSKTYKSVGSVSLQYKIAATGCFIDGYLVTPICEGLATLYVVGACGEVFKKIPINGTPTKSLRSYKNLCICVCGNKVIIVDIFSGKLKEIATERNVAQPTLIQIDGAPTLILGGTDSVSGINLITYELKKLYALSGGQIAKNTTSKIGYDRLVEHEGKVYFLENKNSQYALTILDGAHATRVIGLPRAICYNLVSQPVLCKNKAYIATSGAALSADITQEFMNFTVEKNLAPYTDLVVAGGEIVANILTEGSENIRFRAIIGGKIIASSANEGVVYGVEL